MALTDNLLSVHNFDESSGNAADSVGSYTITNTGTLAYSAAKVNNGIVFPGSSGKYGSLTDNGGYSAGTVAFWYKSTGDGSGTSHRIVAKTQVSVSDVFVIKFNNRGRRPSLVIQDTNIVSETTDTLTRDTWYFHVITWDGTNIKWYINNSLVYNVSSNKVVAANSAVNYMIGGWAGNTTEQAQGQMDILARWSRAITSIEASTLYNDGNGNQYPFTTPATSAIKTLNGLAYASTKTKNGLALSSIKTINGLA